MALNSIVSIKNIFIKLRKKIIATAHSANIRCRDQYSNLGYFGHNERTNHYTITAIVAL